MYNGSLNPRNEIVMRKSFQLLKQNIIHIAFDETTWSHFWIALVQIYTISILIFQ